MKPTLYLLFYLVMFSCSKHEHKEKPLRTFILKGTYRGKQADTLCLYYRDSSGSKLEQSVRLDKGTFLFKGSLSSPDHADILSNIKIEPDRDPDFSDVVELFLSPGSMTISLDENHFDRAKITGSPVQDEWNNLQKAYKPINKIRDSLYSKIFALERAGNTPKNHIAHVAIDKELDKYQLESDKKDYHYITAHPQSFLSAYLLEKFLGSDLPSDSIEIYFNPFSDAVKKAHLEKK